MGACFCAAAAAAAAGECRDSLARVYLFALSLFLLVFFFVLQGPKHPSTEDVDSVLQQIPNPSDEKKTSA